MAVLRGEECPECPRRQSVCPGPAPPPPPAPCSRPWPARSLPPPRQSWARSWSRCSSSRWSWGGQRTCQDSEDRAVCWCVTFCSVWTLWESDGRGKYYWDNFPFHHSSRRPWPDHLDPPDSGNNNHYHLPSPGLVVAWLALPAVSSPCWEAGGPAVPHKVFALWWHRVPSGRSCNNSIL